MEVNIYIGFWTFKMKCTQYGICGQVAFKNARASVIFFQSQTGQAKVFSGMVQKFSISLWGGYLCPYLPPSKSSYGEGFTSASHMSQEL